MANFWKNNKKGLLGTILFHGILVLLLVFLGFKPAPVEFPDPEGIIVDFGDSDQGLGEVEPETMNNNPTNPDNNASSDAQEEIMVQDYQETAAVEKHVNQNNNVSENENENVEETDPELDPSSLYQGNNNVDSEGNSTYGGNQGKPDGGESDNYNGGPNGDGISYSMSGRSPVGKFPKPDYPPGNVYGKVVINIKVDKYGKVISVNVGKGTTATDEGLITAAKKAAWKVRFNEDYNSIEQTGTITYNFSLQ